ncbi:MAG: hypothetical protein ACRD7E_28600 [Bryobacteraceae bacterium]
MKAPLLLLVLAPLAAPLAFAAETIEAFGLKWSVPIAADWKVEKDGGEEVLRMMVARPQEKPRRPSQFALAETPDYQRVTVEADVKRLGKSLIIVFAYGDESHFNYAHLSSDRGTDQPVHNGVFHVYGGDRVRISPELGPASIPSADEWYHVRLTHDASTGIVTVAVNGKEIPALNAVDLSLGPGRVGIGSFFETALFKNVTITGTPASTK